MVLPVTPSAMASEKSAATSVEHPGEALQNGPAKATSSRGRHSTPHRTVIVMLAGLLLGVLAAVGHHLWYSHWNHKVVETASWSQTWIKNFGTAFAFLVKMFLAIVTSTAFVQQFWITLKAKPIAIGQVDSMFTVLQSALQFLSVRIWLNNPVLALLAIITWLLPFAAIVTPGTLNVVSLTTTPVVQLRVPQFDFVGKSLSFGAGGNDGGPALGASPQLQRLSMSAASTLQISQIQFPLPNANYELDYFAPAVSCAAAPSAIVSRVETWLEGISQAAAAAPWLSFVPYNLNLVSANYTPLDTQDCSASTFFGDGYNFNYANQSASLVVAMFNNSASVFSYPIVECTLYNASYHVNFQFSYPVQNISVIQRTLHSALNTPGPGTQSDVFGTPVWAYMNIMDAWANILLGYTTGYRGGATSYKTNYQVTALGDLAKGQYLDTEQLSSMLESMFQNITLSLLSDSSFQQNSTTAQPVPVTVIRTGNVYDYQSTELFIAYGLSILVATVCLILGLISIHRNSGSFSNDFSTVLRTTCHPSLREVVDTAQSSGLAPLGKELADVKIVMVGNDGDPNVPPGFRVARVPWDGTKIVDIGKTKIEEHLYHPV